MGLISTIVIGTVAICGYKYFKEEEFKKSVDEKVSKGFDATKDAASKVSSKIQETFDKKKNKDKED